MFENVGSKIKKVVRYVVALEIAVSIIVGCWILAIGEDWAINPVVGIVVAAVGSLAAWIGGLFLYAVGEMTEAVTEIRDMVRRKGTMKTITKNSYTVLEKEEEQK